MPWLLPDLEDVFGVGEGLERKNVVNYVLQSGIITLGRVVANLDPTMHPIKDVEYVDRLTLLVRLGCGSQLEPLRELRNSQDRFDPETEAAPLGVVEPWRRTPPQVDSATTGCVRPPLSVTHLEVVGDLRCGVRVSDIGWRDVTNAHLDYLDRNDLTSGDHWVCLLGTVWEIALGLTSGPVAAFSTQ